MTKAWCLGRVQGDGDWLNDWLKVIGLVQRRFRMAGDTCTIPLAVGQPVQQDVTHLHHQENNRAAVCSFSSPSHKISFVRECVNERLKIL